MNKRKWGEIKLVSIESLTFAVNRSESLTQNNFANKKPILLELEFLLLKKLVLEYQLFLQKESAHLMGKMVSVGRSSFKRKV